jgi:branched-chain amino acid transport system substrate-binding protein
MVVLAAVALQDCGAAAKSLPPAGPNVVRIVSSLPSRGFQAGQAALIAQAIDLAVDERRGGLPQWTIEHVRLDDSGTESGDWSRDVESANAHTAAEDPSVVAYIGPYTSGATAVSLPITNKAHLLHAGPSATWPGLTVEGWGSGEPGKYYPSGARTFVRLMPTDAAQAAAAAKWARSMGINSVFVLSDGSSYSDAMAAAFASLMRREGSQVTGPAVITPPSMEGHKEQVTRSGARALFYAAGNVDSAILVAKALKDMSLPGGVFSADTALGDRFLEEAGDLAGNWHIVFNGVQSLPVSETASGFKSDFERKYGRQPSQFAGNAYDLTNLVLDAVARAGRDRDAIIRSVLDTKGYHGVTGEITFDERGDALHWAMTGYRVANGRFEVDTLLRDTP